MINAEDHAVTMDDEKLICEVKEHPCLFNTKCADYKIQLKKEKMPGKLCLLHWGKIFQVYSFHTYNSVASFSPRRYNYIRYSLQALYYS